MEEQVDLVHILPEASLDLWEEIERIPKKNGPYSSEGLDEDEVRKLMTLHLEKVAQTVELCKDIPDFKGGLEWMNVTEPLSLFYHLKGKIVILDFFTYCCINCMHILHDLKRLEEEFTVKDGVVFIGVHSAKFDNEKEATNVEDAVKRYGITHPVVNDSVEGMWKNLGVSCWPTLYVLGPGIQPLLMLHGEGHYSKLKLFLEETIQFYSGKGTLSRKVVKEIVPLARPELTSSSDLRYPGKIAVNADGTRLAIADTANNRIIVVDRQSGDVLHEIGSTPEGFADGSFAKSKFNAPQGLAFNGDFIYVADTGNHAVRMIDLVKDSVTTIVGNGAQGTDYDGGLLGRLQRIASPWDVALGPGGVVLYIAMAGSHQIWGYFFQDSKTWNRTCEKGRCYALVGSGKEENRNNSYPRSASLAQPSGLSLDPVRGHLYFADSESSCVRVVHVGEKGAVEAVVGGDLNPSNLFAFGDVDGKGLKAKLQHPLAVAYCQADHHVYVADTYNHKMKKIDPEGKTCTTVETPDNMTLSEPGGLCCYENFIYIADTNNHSVKVYDVNSNTFELFIIRPKEDRHDNVRLPCAETSALLSPKGGEVIVKFILNLPSHLILTPGAPSIWKIPQQAQDIQRVVSVTKHSRFTLEREFRIEVAGGNIGSERKAIVSCRVFLCKPDDTCAVKEFDFLVKIKLSEMGPSLAKTVLDYSLVV